MRIKFTLLFITTLFYTLSQGQTTSGTYTNGSNSNAIPTAVSFLNISPDAQSGGMGDAGVATMPNVNANYWNPSKLVFIDNGSELSLSYSPWLRRITPDANLAYLSFAHRLDERNAIGASFRYLNLGRADLFDGNENETGYFRPYELSLDIALARKFGENFSIGLSLRYIHSSLTSGLLTQGQQARPGNSLATDVSLYFRSQTLQFGKDAVFALGLNISNIGSKLSYTDLGQKYFLPTNLKIGVSNIWFLDEYSQLMVGLDLNKLLVPTPPVRDQNGSVIEGEDDNKSVPAGIFGSFGDAPGGLKEEFQEISFSPAFEYWYDKKFAVRVGYLYENPKKGNRQYMTLGTGFKYKQLTIDFSYLLASQESSPLANTLRLSLGYHF
ncbi:type IX secretion system outer membrane channel protein PorV [Mucilaginibacter terrae]|uniref:type IX secretion system outer membrane channel protein PorV n=1 Tax=Mucilaginibacter terrae TaxID=1955052 RepID=UPI003636FA83